MLIYKSTICCFLLIPWSSFAFWDSHDFIRLIRTIRVRYIDRLRREIFHNLIQNLTKTICWIWKICMTCWFLWSLWFLCEKLKTISVGWLRSVCFSRKRLRANVLYPAPIVFMLKRKKMAFNPLLFRNYFLLLQRKHNKKCTNKFIEWYISTHLLCRM